MGRSLKMHQETCPICPGAVNINHTVTIFRTITHGMIMKPLCNMTSPVIHGMANTDTSSDYCDESWPAAEGATASEQAAEIYWAYSRAKARWRSFMGKPTRKVRRFARRAINPGGKVRKAYQKARSSILHHTFPNSMNPNSWNSSQRSGPREERRVLEAERVRADGEIPEARMDVG